MGANNNNNNSYGNHNEDTHFNDLQQVSGDSTVRCAAVLRRRLSAAVGGREDSTTDMVRQQDEAIRADCAQGGGRAENQTDDETRINHHHLTSCASPLQTSSHTNKTSLLVTILLPFVLVFLLPSSNHHLINRSNQISQQQQQNTRDESFSVDQLLVSLLRLPLDRFRLSSGYSMLANAKEIHLPAAAASSVRQVSDLQEEETHVLMAAPEQRNSYQPLAPIRQAPPGYGGSAAADATGEAYGAGDYASSSSSGGGNSHANLAATGGSSDLSGGGGGGEDQAAGAEVMPASASGSVLAPPGGSSTAAQRTDLPSVRALNVKCEKNHMTVNIVFDRPFYGMVFSKGHYNDRLCVHLPPNSGQTSINFDIHLGKCGMSSSSDSGSSSALTSAGTNGQALQANGAQQQPNGVFIENTIIIQYDPQVQEIYDQARRLRCTWYDYYEKSVSFRPYNVDMLDAVTANFLGDNIQCWMQIQVGKGPWASEVAGIVKIGQTMTMVLAIKDDENKFDMLVRNCVASDGKHQPIQLVDEYGCVARPKIMSKFQKVKNFGPAASVVSYAHFQAFKFPDSMSVHFQCVIQVCRYECPEPVCSSSGASSAGAIDGNSAASIGAQSGGDYAVSGTELVSSKEPLPAAIIGRNLSHHHLSQQQQHGGSNSVNLKLDESQGRVQVKLDTSMMANVGTGGNNLRASGGALPPHLLHAASEQQTVGQAASNGRPGYLSSSYYRPSLGGASASVASRPSAVSRPGQTAALPPPVGGQPQYSSPVAATSSLLPHYHHPRPAYMMTNRMGELVAEDNLPVSSPHTPAGRQVEEDALKLSLIATPRALPYAMPTTASTQQQQQQQVNNHRYRRSIEGKQRQDSNKTKRQAPPGGDSTAIKTQRTIQVVSPDDVAFNLINDFDGSSPAGGGGGWQQDSQQRRRPAKPPQSVDTNQELVCFSAGRLITSALASLTLLAMLILAAALIIMRQRRRLSEKLSPVYDSTSVVSSPDLMTSINQHQQYEQQQRQRELVILRRRQQEEMQQRNTYLGRLYSQFVPATYWRQ